MKPDMKTFARNLASFRQMTWIAFGATFFLVAVGGVVRVTGSGLGCPDWPTCWGCWLPPSSQEVIPTQVSSDGRTYYEDKFGRKHALSEFDAAKMWIEYLNRLVGVAIGLLILWAFLRSLRLRKTSPRHFQGALLALLMVAFQGWLGAVVVRSELVPGIITLHMVIAMILLCLLLLGRSAREKGPDCPAENQADPRPRASRILAGAVLVQVILGTRAKASIPSLKTLKGAWGSLAGELTLRSPAPPFSGSCYCNPALMEKFVEAERGHATGGLACRGSHIGANGIRNNTSLRRPAAHSPNPSPRRFRGPDLPLLHIGWPPVPQGQKFQRRPRLLISTAIKVLNRHDLARSGNDDIKRLPKHAIVSMNFHGPRTARPRPTPLPSTDPA